jgi:hypothetical protein
MRTQAFFYSFDTKTKPGTMNRHGVRFETMELDVKSEAAQAANLPILCEDHRELKAVPLTAFKHAVSRNFPSS